MERRKKILWLVSWYPNKYEPFAGDFIQRHAQTAAIDNSIHVIFVTDSAEQNCIESISTEKDHLTEQIIYYKTPIGFLRKIKKQLYWFKHFKKAFKDYVKLNGLPHLVHVHIPWKAGLIALWIKKKYGIQYIITEHWNIYNNVVSDNIDRWPQINQQLLKKIFFNADEVISVSHFLGDCLVSKGFLKSYVVIPNVVNTSIFSPVAHKGAGFTFIHISNMVPLKNVKGIIDSFYLFLSNNKRTDIRLVLVGNSTNEYAQYTTSLSLLNTFVFFKGEVAHRQVAEEMGQSHCLILNSDIENAPCVIAEAHCMGIPVIATKVGGIPEMVNSDNGLLVSARNNQELINAFTQIVKTYPEYDKLSIASTAEEKYGIAAIASFFNKIYDDHSSF